MKGLIKARGICVRISIAHDGHRATQGLHALLAALLVVADRALCTHTALPMPCYLKNGINEPRSWSGRPWCHSSSRRAHRVFKSGVARFAQRGLCVRRLQPTRHRLPATKSIAALRRAVHRVAQHVQRLHHLRALVSTHLASSLCRIAPLRRRAWQRSERAAGVVVSRLAGLMSARHAP